MIAVDSSAVVAVALGEPEAERFATLLEGSVCLVGWPTLLEVQLVLSSYGKPKALRAAELWREGPDVRPIEFDRPLFEIACRAFERYGKGRGSKAKLNFGDCMAYAVARHFDLPLLYKGTDFALTDIRPALP
jgi:ribonuclease VapC